MRSPAETFRIVRSQASPTRFVVSRLLRAARVSDRVSFRLNDQVRLRLYPSHITEQYWMNRQDRAEDHRFLELILAEGDTVVDVGANIGALAIHAAQLVGSTGRVIAIEAHPRIYGYLVGNIRLNGCRNIETLNVAAGSKSGTLLFTDLASDDYNRVAEEGIEVPVGTLDNLIGEVDVDLMKVDVEGFELQVFEGATRTLAATRAIYFESSDQCRRFGHEPAEVVDLLRHQGFDIYRPECAGWVRLEPGYEILGHHDLVAVRDPSSLRL